MLLFRYFEYLAVEGDRMKYDLARAAIEARQCTDLLSQAKWHVKRAQKIDEEERQLRRRQKEESERFRLKQLSIQKKMEEERKQKIEELARAREEYKERMKGATVIEDIPADAPKKRKWRKCYKSSIFVHSRQLQL